MVDREFDLAEYAEAEVQRVFLTMYNWVGIKRRIISRTAS